MELFVSAIDEGSLSAGARRLGRPPAAATRAVSMLERETGESLLVRTTRHIGLTVAGEHWLPVWRDVLGRLTSGREDSSFGGTFALTAPELFGRTWVQPIIEHFLADHPKVEVRLVLLSRSADLMEEGLDLAIRVGELPPTGAAATRLGDVRTLLCASPDYLDRYGMPEQPSKLRLHTCIGTGPTSNDVWKMADNARDGRMQAFAVRTRIAVNSWASVLESTLRGSGIGQVMSCQASEHLQAGRLILVMPQHCCGPMPVHLVFRSEPPRAGPVRDFVDFAVPLLRRRLGEVSKAVEAMF